MALPLVIANTVQIRLLFNINNALAVNVLHGIVPTGFVSNQTVANTLGSAVKGAWTTHLAGLCSAGTSLVRVGLRDVRQPNLTEFLDSAGVASGTGTGDALPGGLSVCVTLRTAKSGKSNRGRMYLGGFNEAQNDPSGFTSTATQTAIGAFCTALDTALDGSQITHAVASRPSERVTVVQTTFHADGTSTVKVLSETTAKTGESNAVTLYQQRSGLWESQRRRMNGRGVAPAAITGVMTVQSQAGQAAG